MRDWLTRDIDLTPNAVERFTEATRRTTETEKFLRAYNEKPDASEEELKASIQRMSDSQPSLKADEEVPEKEDERDEAENDTTNADKEIETSSKVHVGHHERSQPTHTPESTDTGVMIRFPTSKKTAFNEVVPQIIDLLRKSEMCDGFNDGQKALVQTVITVLDSGIKRTKSA